MLIFWLCIGIAALVGFIYTLCLFLIAAKELRSWLHTFIATLISVLFAVSVGILLFNYQTKIVDKNRKEQLEELLPLELSNTSELLSSDKFFVIYSTSYRDSTIITYIQPLVLEEAVRSGLFDTHHTGKMLQLGQEMRVYNTQVSYLLSSLAGEPNNPKYREVLKNAIMNLEISRKKIVAHSLILSEIMDLSLIICE
ncbi:hypothetical protein KAX02_08230 [candidate division WOR-3 bacterium]|nr:hypothetical protein [candidate division WOR-3 bacterium]